MTEQENPAPDTPPAEPATDVATPGPSASEQQSTEGVARLRLAIRRSIPSAEVHESLDLAERMLALTGARADLLPTTEELLGLRSGEIQTLTAVAGGCDHPRSIARRTGQLDAAAVVTVDSLVERGLLARHRDVRAPANADPALVHVTAAGEVVLRQAEALQLRLLDAVVDTLAEADGHLLREAMDRVEETLLGTGGPALVRSA
ncbi:MarR family winged helix-turn-helix transcriptional regulator [Georgenia sp. TF02-10]|uniref:MarR family winged helix-turn-helix transcriptional regulator n=1 Tax=Georgenia sp. TF02-10 TaxID=2917725 RepID=UPI001FA6E1CC|nr:MarR family winged helix-turn-helix transcriptional regulator [Georgenia sp. TF02-10]UNX53671.1 MarR family winged helix-turn-helix transcriptional regulator [Georgenia sp. TF02-10]